MGMVANKSIPELIPGAAHRVPSSFLDQSVAAVRIKDLKQHAGRVISRNELLSEVWGYQNYPFTRTVDNHILRLRQKLETDPTQPIHFRTVHGVGYKFLP